MLPEETEIDETKEEKSDSKSYRIDFEKKRLRGIIDGKEALEQAILLMLLTRRYEYAIYSHSYGTDWDKVLGKSYLKAMAAAKTAIIDSLMCDDRITAVDNFEFEKKEHGMKIKFRVKSVYGDIDTETEVGENGDIVL